MQIRFVIMPLDDLLAKDATRSVLLRLYTKRFAESGCTLGVAIYFIPQAKSIPDFGGSVWTLHLIQLTSAWYATSVA